MKQDNATAKQLEFFLRDAQDLVLSVRKVQIECRRYAAECAKAARRGEIDVDDLLAARERLARALSKICISE